MERERVLVGCYLAPGRQRDSGDFQLEARIGADYDWTSIAHLAIDHSCTAMNMGMNLDLQKIFDSV